MLMDTYIENLLSLIQQKDETIQQLTEQLNLVNSSVQSQQQATLHWKREFDSLYTESNITLKKLQKAQEDFVTLCNFMETYSGAVNQLVWAIENNYLMVEFVDELLAIY